MRSWDITWRSRAEKRGSCGSKVPALRITFFSFFVLKDNNLVPYIGLHLQSCY